MVSLEADGICTLDTICRLVADLCAKRCRLGSLGDNSIPLGDEAANTEGVVDSTRRGPDLTGP